MPQPKLPIDQHRAATGVRLPKPLFAALNAYCENQRYSRTEIIETAIQHFLEREGAYPQPDAPAPFASQSVSVVSKTASASP